jgi:hypothetical protein
MTGWSFFGHGLQNDPEAKRLVDERIAHLRGAGWRLRTGWDRKAPFGVTDDGGGLDGLLDHLYRLVTPSGKIIYVTEPYWLHDFAALALAAVDGWDVAASSTEALWYPGHTVAVRFTRKAGS